MTKFLKGAGLAGLASALPIMALAQGQVPGLRPVDSIPSAFQAFIDIINNYVIPLLFALALLYFLLGVLKFVKGAGDPKVRAEGKDMIIWGIVGIFIMVSVWGLVGLLTGTFRFDRNQAPAFPDASAVNRN